MPGGEADSAGFPWQGRTFDHHVTAFEHDDGAAPQAFRASVLALREAAARFRKGSATDAKAIEALAAAHAEALLELSAGRVLIPLLAEAGDIGLTPEGRTVEKTQELSIVTVEGVDGRRVLPVFSSVDTMRAWNPEARPIPVPAPQAAIAAAQEHTDLIIVDPGSPEFEFGVRRTQLEALALRGRVLAPWADPIVHDVFSASVQGLTQVCSVSLAPGDPEARLLEAETEVVLEMQPGLDRETLTHTLEVLQQRWAASELVASRVDSLRVRLR